MTKKVSDFNRSALTKKSDYHYWMKGDFTPLDVYWSKYHKTLTVRGSLPWHYQGHNLSFKMIHFQDVINDLSLTLDTDMNYAGVKTFELSKIIPVDYPVIEYQNNHHRLKGFERFQTRNTLYYNSYTRSGNKYLTLKMYDATANAISKKMSFIPEGYRLKLELKIHNPSRNFGWAISVKDMINKHEIVTKAYSEMKHHYYNIQKGLTVKLPDNPSTDDIITAALLESNPNPIPLIENLINSSNLEKQGRYKKRRLSKKKIDRVTVQASPYELDL